MLNISDNRITNEVQEERYFSFKEVIDPKPAKVMAYWLVGMLLAFIISLFIPWTQNIQAKGKVTTLRPGQRPQEIVSTVAGRIEQWYVNEGDTVRAGDTILYVSEVKDKFFDPLLELRTSQQIDAKKDAIQAYNNKARALSQQGENLEATMAVKLEEGFNKVRQQTFKVQADSIDLVAAFISDSIAQLQMSRWDTLYQKGLKSQTDREKIRKQSQEARSKLIAQQNKLESSSGGIKNRLFKPEQCSE